MFSNLCGCNLMGGGASEERKYCFSRKKPTPKIGSRSWGHERLKALCLLQAGPSKSSPGLVKLEQGRPGRVWPQMAWLGLAKQSHDMLSLVWRGWAKPGLVQSSLDWPSLAWPSLCKPGKAWARFGQAKARQIERGLAEQGQAMPCQA